MRTVNTFKGYIRLENKQEYDVLAALLDSQGFTWGGGEKLTQKNYIKSYPCFLNNEWRNKSCTWTIDDRIYTKFEEFLLGDEFTVQVSNQQEFNDVQDYCMKFGTHHYHKTGVIGFDSWKDPIHRDYGSGSSASSFVKFSTSDCCYNSSNTYNLPTISYKEFKILSTINTEPVEKEIIGYTLVKTEYADALLKIAHTIWGIPKYEITNPDSIKLLKEAGVLDLWCEPIYEEEFKVGDWVEVINAGAGANGANGSKGQITDKPSTNGLFSSEKGINVKTKKGEVWKVNPSAELRKLSAKEIEELNMKVFILYHKDGFSQLRVDKRGIFFPDDYRYLDVKALEKIISRVGVIDGSYTYYYIPEFVNLGCKKNVSAIQIKEVIDYFKSL